jgi:hypothetical protein
MKEERNNHTSAFSLDDGKQLRGEKERGSAYIQESDVSTRTNKE